MRVYTNIRNTLSYVNYYDVIILYTYPEKLFNLHMIIKLKFLEVNYGNYNRMEK
jgi:hypothetical protein